MFCQTISSGLHTKGLYTAFRLIDLPYSEIEIALFNIIVNRIGEALENISLFEELKKQNINLQKEIIERKKTEKEKKILQVKLELAKRMESIELLVGGVAHDLNNILCPLVGYPQLIRMKLKNNIPIDREIEIIEKAALRASNEVKDLATISRKSAYPKKSVNLNAAIEEYFTSATMIEYEEKYPDVKIIKKLDKDIKNISGSMPHLTKLIMNLVCNAYEFMPEGGELTITTSSVKVDKTIYGYEDILPGNYSLLKITDNGSGISESDIIRIFEPYYTKKIHSMTGSGLGLWVVYGIVKEHNALIDVNSENRNGSVFNIYFPALEQEEEETKDSRNIKSIRGTEKILVIDDEIELRTFLSDALKQLNYDVYVAENGRAAVKFLSEQSVNLIILDMIMENDFDGLDTYREILRIHPEQKAIISSGFSVNERIEETLKLGASQFLKKPYTIMELGEAIRNGLDK